jgi:hypothetical protein
LRWQSIIVTPQKAGWMPIQKIADEESHGWWKRCRDVPCSWISSRGEAERFLFYDGPTRFPPVVNATLSGNELNIIPRDSPSQRHRGTFFNTLPDTPKHTANQIGHERQLLFIEVERAIKGCRLESQLTPQLIELDKQTFVIDDAVEQTLLQMIVDYGMIDAWRPQFFKTDGRRVLKTRVLKTRGREMKTLGWTSLDFSFFLRS